MRALTLVSLTLTIAIAVAPQRARANAIALTFEDRAGADPATGFEDDCLGETEAEDCDMRAAALETELLEHLVALSFEADAETLQLFEEMVPMEAPRVQEVAVSYFASQPTPPASIADRVRAFFFGPDPGVGYPAAELWSSSGSANEQALAARYLTGRTEATHGGTFPGGIGFDDTWADGVARDIGLDAARGFAEDERYPGAARLLMDDRYLFDVFSGENPPPEMAVTAFVTEDALDVVVAHFAAVFGRAPFPSPEETEGAQQEILDEMATLEDDLMNGDEEAMERYVELSNELAVLNQSSTIAMRMGLDEMGARDAVFWSDLDPALAYEGPMLRSAAVRRDTALDGTVVLLYAGATGTGGEGEGEGEGEGDLDDLFGDDGLGGCGCAAHAPGYGSAAPGLMALALLVCGPRFRRRAVGRAA